MPLIHKGTFKLPTANRFAGLFGVTILAVSAWTVLMKKVQNSASHRNGQSSTDEKLSLFINQMGTAEKTQQIIRSLSSRPNTVERTMRTMHGN